MEKERQPELVPDRQRSGLVRSFGIFGAFLFGIHCISLSSSGYIPFSWVASVWPGANIIGVLTIAAAFCILHGASYAIIGSTVSLAGSDYVFTSRTLSPAVAFAGSWTLVIFSGVVTGGLASWIPQSAIPALFRPMAIIFGDSRFQYIADFSASATGSMIIGGAVLLLGVFSVTTSNINIQRLLTVGLILGLVAWGLIYISLGTAHGPADFRTAWDKFMGTTGSFGAYDQRIALAQKAGMNISSSWVPMTLAGLIMGFWIFYGYYIPTFFSEEIRKPAKTLFYASASSIIVSLCIFVLGAVLLQRLTSSTWIAAEGFLFNNADAASKAAGGEKVLAMPWITFYAAILKPKAWIIGLVAFGWIFTLINLVQTYFYYSSRIVLSWALDRVVPQWVTVLSKRSNAPTRAILIFAILAFYGLYDASTGGPLGTQMIFVFFAVATQLIPVFALMLLPVLSPDLYKQAPNFVRKTFLGIPRVSLIGAGTLSYLIWMLVACFLYPAVGVKDPRSTIILLGIILASGVIWFYGIRYYRRRRQGIDILLTYRRPLPSVEAPEFE